MARYSNRSLLVGALVCGALVVGVFVGFLLDSDESATSPPPTGENAVTGPGPHDEVNGVPVGYARTEEGALVAAQQYALISASDLIRDRDEYILALETVASSDWEVKARTQAINGFKFFRERYGPDVDVTATVVRNSVLQYSADVALVKLWTVSLATGSERGTVDEVWGTSEIRLVWADDDWRINDVTNQSGPAPVDLPLGENEETAQELMETLDEVSP